MSAAVRALQVFRAGLVQRAERIKRGTMATEVTFGPVKDLEFTVTVKWPPKGQYTRTYSYGSVFRYGGTRMPRPRQSVCQVQRELVQSILKARGV